MKTVVVLALLLALVAGVAATGSRAEALAATSIAFEQCRGADADRCQPLSGLLLAQTEAEMAAADRDTVGAGAGAGAGAEVGESRAPLGWAAFDGWAAAAVRYILERVGDWIFRQTGGSLRPSQMVVAETVFDPVR